MKTIHLLSKTTQLEIYTNFILALLIVAGALVGFMPLVFYSALAIAILHSTSLLLHWLVWKELRTTQPYRLLLSLWVLSSFICTLLAYCLLGPLLMVMLCLLLLFSLMWFVFTLHILFKEHDFLKRRIELYEQRELIHF